jgi:hypothetical protein
MRHQEVEQTPQLHKIVLERRARQQQPALCLKPQQGLPPLRAKVLDVVRLVQDHVDPRLAPEDVLVGDDDLVRRDADLPRVLGEPADALLLPLLLVAVIRKDLEAWEKLLEFHLPIQDDGGRDDDEVLAPDATIACQVAEQRDGLDSLATHQLELVLAQDLPESHLVRQDPVHIIGVKPSKPVEPCVLIRP